MGRFTQSINRHAMDFNALHHAIHETFKRRDHSTAEYAEWRAACDAFHAYTSQIHEWVTKCLTSDLKKGSEEREFLIEYLRVDPIYFRSGYLKERLLTRIKRCDLTTDEARTLRACLMAVALGGGRREFRHYCRLIPKIGIPDMRGELEGLVSSPNGKIASCARLALGYF